MKIFMAVIAIAIMGALTLPLLTEPQWEWIGVKSISVPSDGADDTELSAVEKTFLQFQIKAARLYSDVRLAIDESFASATSKFNELMAKGSRTGADTGSAAGDAAGAIGGRIGGN